MKNEELPRGGRLELSLQVMAMLTECNLLFLSSSCTVTTSISNSHIVFLYIQLDLIIMNGLGVHYSALYIGCHPASGSFCIDAIYIHDFQLMSIDPATTYIGVELQNIV